MIGPAPLVGISAALVGACLGSFASTVAVRAGSAEAALFGRSRCDNCRTHLGFASTVPMISWVQRGGACSTCGARIALLHPIGELAGASLGLALAITAVTPVQAGLLAVLGFALLTASLVDLQTLKLPDALTAVIGVAAAGLAYERSPGDLWGGLAAGATAFVLLEAVRRSFLKMRGNAGLGFGDVKLVAALAIWLGPLTSWTVAAAALLGLLAFRIWRPVDGRLPFGPCLALSAGAIGLIHEAGLWPAFL